MHVEKNMFDQVINAIMDVKGRTKDDINASRDLVTHCSVKYFISRQPNMKMEGEMKLSLMLHML